MSPQHITLEQLVRLYAARNEANSRMSAALRSKDRALIQLATAEASDLNRAYDAAQRAYKGQQKAARKAQWRSTLIRFYLDTQTTQPGGAAPAH